MRGCGFTGGHHTRGLAIMTRLDSVGLGTDYVNTVGQSDLLLSSSGGKRKGLVLMMKIIRQLRFIGQVAEVHPHS